MSNVHELHNKDQRSLEASAWIAKLDKGLSSAESDEIRRWIESDPRNKALLSQLAGLWDDMDSLSRLSELFPKPLAENGQGRNRWILAAASGFAVVAALLVSLFVTTNTGDGTPVENAIIESAAYQTAIGGLSTIQLSDGSQITLNTNSHITVEFTERQRVVHLQRGELHIEVAHDPSRPLSVVVGDRIVQAMGTAFTVRLDENERIVLLVTDGTVKVGVAPALLVNANHQSMGKSLIVSEHALSVSGGERIMLGKSGEFLEQLEPGEVEVQLSWRNGNLIFRGESLGEAAAEISRYTPVEFVFLDKDLQNVRVAGLFKTGDVSGFLSSLEANLDIVHNRIDEETIQLSSFAGDAN